jgi:hypothetical protein
MKKLRYRCEYVFEEKHRHAWGESILDFINGFWVNDDLVFTKKSDARFFILPHSIRYIMKEGPLS